METIFTIHLLNETDYSCHEIDFINYDSVLGNHWAELLIQSIDADNLVREPNRIIGFSDVWNFDNTKRMLTDNINTLLEYEPGIITTSELEGEWNQELLNVLHKHYEDIQNDYHWVKQAPREVQQALLDFNINIHRLETAYRNNTRIRKQPKKIVCSMNEREKIPMTPYELTCFGSNIRPGDINLKYCHTGKTIWDVWRSDDDPSMVSTPHTSIGPDFIINFTHSYTRHGKYKLINWMHDNDVDIETNIPIGAGVVGKILGDVDKISKEISGVTRIMKVTYRHVD